MSDFDDPLFFFNATPDQSTDDENVEDPEILGAQIQEQETKLTKLEEALRESEEIKAQNEELQDTIFQLTQKVAILEKQNESQKMATQKFNELSNANRNADKERISELQKASERAQSDNLKLQQQNKDLTKKLEEAKAETEALRHEESVFFQKIDENGSVTTLSEAAELFADQKNRESSRKSSDFNIKEERDFERELKHLEKKIKRLNAEKEGLAAEKEEILAEDANKQQKIEQMKYEINAKEIDFNSEKESLINSKEEVEQNLKVCQTKLATLLKKFKELETENEDNQNKISKLEEGLLKSKEKGHKRKEKTGKLKYALRDTIEQNETSIKMTEETFIQNDEYATVIESLNTEIKEKDEQNNDYAVEISKQNENIKELEETVKIHENEIKELRHENYDLSNQISEMEGKKEKLKQDNQKLKESVKGQIEAKDKKISELEKENRSVKEDMQKELAKARAKLEEAKKQQMIIPKQEKIIEEVYKEVPKEVWQSKEMPEDLQEKITQIGENSQTELPEKISALVSFLTDSVKENEEKDAEIDNLKIKEEFLIKLFNETINLTKEITSCEAVSSDKENGNRYIKKVKSCITKMNKTVNEASQNAILLNSITKLLRRENATEVPSAIKTILDQRAKTVAEVKELKSELENTVYEQSRSRKQLEQYQESLKGKLRSLTEKYDKVCKENQENTFKMNSMKISFESEKKNQETRFQEMNEKWENEINEEKERSNREQKKLSETIEKSEAIISKLTKHLEKCSNKLKETKIIMKDREEKFNKDLEEAEKSYIEKSKADQENAQSEIEELHDVYDKLLATLKAQKEELEVKINESNEVIVKQQQANSILAGKLRKLEEENGKAKKSVSNAKSQYSVRIKALETAHKAEKIGLQNTLNNEKLQMQKEANSKVKNLVNNVALQFVEFCDPKQRIDEESCLDIIKKVHEKMDELKNQDMALRIILGISETDSIEEQIKIMQKMICNSLN